MSSEWISVEDRLPELGEGDFPCVYVLTAKRYGDGKWVVGECAYRAWRTAKRASAREPRFERNGRIYEGVTHWQPLPAPPQQEEK